MTDTNPLRVRSAIPAFNKIRGKHFPEAFDDAFAQMHESLERLRTDSSPPTFENTVLAIEDLFKPYGDLSGVFSVLMQAKSTNLLFKISEKSSQKLSDLSKDLYQDPRIAARFLEVYNARATLNLDEEDIALLESTYQAFEQEGSFLDPVQKARLKAIDAELIKLCNSFNQNILKAAEQQAVLFTEPADLVGVDDQTVAAMADAAAKAKKQGWLFVPERLLVDDLLTVAQSRHFRETIYKALNKTGTQAPYDNEGIIGKIHALRYERANLLGYPDHATYRVSTMMTGSLATAQKYLAETARHLTPAFEAKIETVQKFSAQNGGPEKFEPWDVDFWANKYVQDGLKFSSSELAPYLEINAAMQVMFDYVEEYFGIKLKEVSDFPVYHKDVKAYEVRDAATGELKGYFLNDIYQRSKKESGAWMQGVQTMTKRGDLNLLPIVTNNANYTKPVAGSPTLISLENFVTQFHEMGHGLHGLLGYRGKYESLHGTADSSDFVEIHSQIFEQFASDPDCVKAKLRDYRTGAPVPAALVDKMFAAREFSDIKQILKVVHNSMWDFGFHTMKPEDYKGTESVEKTYRPGGKYDALLRPYKLTRFGHIMSDPIDGYSAGYFGYLTSQIHAVAGYEYLKTAAEAKAKLPTLYGRGSSIDGNVLFRDYYGGPATIEPLLRSLGIMKKAPTQNAPAPG